MITKDKSKKIVGGTIWTPFLGWEKDAHPWMSAYCGYMALALHERFPQTKFALEYYLGVPSHALIHQENIFYDARGSLPDYDRKAREGRSVFTHLDLDDLESSGLLLPKTGVRTITRDKMLPLAHCWLDRKNFHSLKTIPPGSP